MSPGERGPVPLSELLAKEGYGRKQMVKSEAHHGLERASQLACFSDEQICCNSEPHHGSDIERNKLYEHSSGKRERFSDQRMHLSKEKAGSTYKSRNYLLNGETPKRVYRSASLENWKYRSGDYSKYPANDSFEEENSDTCWKSGSLSNEPLIHHKVDGYIKRKSWICSQDKAIGPRKSNMDIKGKTWICSQDKPESPRKIYDKFRVKSQAKVPKSIRRQSLLAEKKIDNDLEFIDGGIVCTKARDMTSVILC
uniref:Uncharacterized protein n=1 Tax=Nymphaea colorata TaxID=210225 RepID=A0A5K1GPY4_9MAGN